LGIDLDHRLGHAVLEVLVHVDRVRDGGEGGRDLVARVEELVPLADQAEGRDPRLYQSRLDAAQEHALHEQVEGREVLARVGAQPLHHRPYIFVRVHGDENETHVGGGGLRRDGDEEAHAAAAHVGERLHDWVSSSSQATSSRMRRSLSRMP
jgi:hypothetical protein